jgi:hypothetical protein
MIPLRTKYEKEYYKFGGISYFKAQIEYLIRIFFHPQNQRIIIQILTDQ